MKSYKAVIVGCGNRADAHIEAYRHLPTARVVACSAPSPTRRDPLAKKYDLKAYADAEEMIRQEKPDIVHLITWPSTRVELMSLVSDLGVPLCTVEKPIAVGVEDWRALQKLEARSKTKFAVCHQFRWQADLVRCRKAFQRESCGAPRFLDMSAGMNIAGQGTHTLNYGRSLIGDPRVQQVFANASGWDTSDVGHPAPSTTEACLVFENGVRGLWTSGAISPRCGDPTTVWQHVRMAAYADKGRVSFEEFGKWEIVTPEKSESGTYGGMDSWREGNFRAQADFHQAMFTWAEDEARAPGTSLDQSLHEWAVVLALYESALERRPIELENFDPPANLFQRLSSGGLGS